MVTGMYLRQAGPHRLHSGYRSDICCSGRWKSLSFTIITLFTSTIITLITTLLLSRKSRNEEELDIEGRPRRVW